MKNEEAEALHMAYITQLVEIFSKYFASPLESKRREKDLRNDLDEAEILNRSAADVIEVRARARAGGTAGARSSSS